MNDQEINKFWVTISSEDASFHLINSSHKQFLRPDLMVEQAESPKKFNMKKVTIVDEEEARNTRKSRPKQQRKAEAAEHDDSDDSGNYIRLI